MSDGVLKTLLNSPDPVDLWKTFRNNIGQHCDKEKGRPPINFIHCLIDELRKRGILTEEEHDTLNRDVYRKPLDQIYNDMDHVHGSGIWSEIGRKISGAASKGVAGITAHQIANKAGNAILDGASSTLRNKQKRF